MKKLSTIIFLVAVILAALCATPALALENSLYFIVGFPDPSVETMFPVTLQRINRQNNLEIVRNVCELQVHTVGIREYYEERLIVVKSMTYDAETRTAKFSVIHMDRPLEEKRFEEEYTKEYSDLGSYLFNIPEKGIYQGLELYHITGKLGRFVGLNLQTMKKEPLSPDVYRNIVLAGKVGGAIADIDLVRAFMNKKSYIQIMGAGELVETPWKLPDDVNYKRNNLVSIYVNNNILALTTADDREKVSSGTGNTTYYVLDKKLNKWQKFKIKGDSSGVRSFGKWLAGYVSSKNKKENIPGKEKRRQKPTKTGIPADWRFEYLGEYAPGILFIYNSDTQKKYEIETGQDDSEVLLVEGDYVYYRVYDEIYKSKIDKDKLEEPVLLVKDDAVPDIHWAFFGPKVDVQTGEVQTR